MLVKADTLDDLLINTYQKILSDGVQVSPSRGATREVIGAMLILTNPLARLSRSESRGKIFSALGELIWYLSGSNDLEQIAYYIKGYRANSDDDKTLHGAYGPRLFKMHGKINQYQNVISLLTKKQSSRRAVIQIYDASDLEKDYKEIPCTCNLQFLVRDGKVHAVSFMRSNDAYLGLPHDIFAFTMLQEILARELNLEIGTYTHSVGSLHIYEEHLDEVKKYISEGYQSTLSPMPAMPKDNLTSSKDQLIRAEDKLRRQEDFSEKIPPYWIDLIGLLNVFQASKGSDLDKINLLKEKISNIYHVYIDQLILNKTINSGK